MRKFNYRDLNFLLKIFIGYLRGLFYGKLNVVMLKGSRLRYSYNIKIGKNTIIYNQSIISGLGNDGVIIGRRCSIGDYTKIESSADYTRRKGKIRIGNNVRIGEFSYLGGAGGLTIGNDVIMGQYISFHPENHIYERNKLIRRNSVSHKGIKVGSNCWIGSKATFLDGSSVGDDCIVAAGAVVTKNFNSGLIIGGVPAKIIKKIDD